MDGMINVYKEQGFTSHDVAAKLRGMLHVRKIGHTGTLDPDATGVLPVCVGSATRLCDLLNDRGKTYRAVMRLGIRTDSDDISGKVVETSDLHPYREQVAQVLSSFAGDSLQVPPMFSARKVGGRRLYDLAREGRVVEREATPVHIDSIELEDYDQDLRLAAFTVSCSRGTYIRSICRDAGEKLGCHGTMESLERTRVGIFRAEDAYTLSEIQEIVDREGSADSIIYPLSRVFEDFPAVTVPESEERYLKNGNDFRCSVLPADYPDIDMDSQMVHFDKVPEGARVYRFFLPDGCFAGLYYVMPEDSRAVHIKMFFAS